MKLPLILAALTISQATETNELYIFTMAVQKSMSNCVKIDGPSSLKFFTASSNYVALTHPDNAPFATNVVITSSLKPIVIETNGQWQITFK
jgi:hypothetical protein